MCALLHKQRCYSHLPQQEVVLPVEFLHLELSYRGRLAAITLIPIVDDLSLIKQERTLSRRLGSGSGSEEDLPLVNNHHTTKEYKI